MVITTGTFLNGIIHLGSERIAAGRIGDRPSLALAETIRNIGFQMGRLKTGTPPRLLKNSINYDQLDAVSGDEIPEPFSFMNERVRIDVSMEQVFALEADHTLIR